MWAGVKHVLRALAVFGSAPFSTSEKVCGPTWLGLVSLTIRSSSPSCTVDGPTKPSFLPSSFISIVVTASPGIAVVDSAVARFGTTSAANRANAASGVARAAARDFFRFICSFQDDKGDEYASLPR